MDQHHIAALTRALSRVPSRRDVLRGLAGAGLGLGALRQPETADAKKKRKKKKKTNTAAPPPPTATCTPTCRRKVCGGDGCGGSCGSCAAGQLCRSGTCCTPEPPEVTCAGRCGQVTGNTCHEPVACACPSGQECLSNGSCATVCTPSANPCPNCTLCGASIEGANHCSGWTYCESQTCTSTAECPVGTYCMVTMCGPGGSNENQCMPLCND